MTEALKARSIEAKTLIEEPRHLSPLTTRQRQIAMLFAHGYRKREIAAMLALDKRVVKQRVREVCRELGVFNRQQLTTYITGCRS